MNKKRLILALVLGLILALVCTAAALADDPLKVSMDLSASKFSGPKTITVTISVRNVGEGDLPGPVTLYYPSSKKVEEFGSPTLSVGASKTWSGAWTVTQNQLDAGKVTFKIKYSMYDDSGKLVNKTKNFSKRITFTGADPVLNISRSIKPTTAQKGQQVSVVYEIENTGSVEVTNVSIKENSSISGKTGTVDSIAVGEKKTYTFTATMDKKDLTSAATVSFKAGGKTYTQKIEAAKIKYGEVKLRATLTADKKGGAPGDPLKLKLTLKNSGTVDFTNVTVTDAALGTVFSGETVPAGETVLLEKDLTITESQDLQFTVTAENPSGEPVETATGRISVIATDPTQQIILNVEAQSDRDTVYTMPGNVRFTVTVRNDSAVDVKNIAVKAVGTTLYTFDSIPAGQSRTFTRDTAVSMAGSYQFTAVAKDQLGQELNFGSNLIQIGYSRPTPVPTEAPIVTPPAPQYEKVPTEVEIPDWMNKVEGIAKTAKWPLAGFAAILIILLLIGAIRRGVSKSQSNKAMDHLHGANYRDYSTAPRGGKRSEITDNAAPAAEEKPAEDIPETENTVQDSELMAETLKRLYSDKKPEEAPVEVVTEDSKPSGTKPAEEPAEPAPAAEPVQSAADAAHRRRVQR